MEDITLIVADNTSEDGVGRIVSVDASKRAIVWDSHTGDELARYDAFAEIKVVAWMKNGNLAFGGFSSCCNATCGESSQR